MKLLVSLESWKKWVREEDGRFAVDKHPQPKKFPCYAYMELESWGQETLKPMYLYREDVDRMAVELLASSQRF